MKLENNILNTEGVVNLLELLNLYRDKLPKDLQKNIIEIEESGINDMDAESFRNKFMMNSESVVSCYPFDHRNIISINKILKKVTMLENFMEIEHYPSSFYIEVNGKKVIQW